MGKIQKLTKDIDRLRKDIDRYEEKLIKARELHKKGRFDKDKWAKIRHKYQEKIRTSQVAIRRKEKARLTFEKQEREKREKKESK
ncbi:MAG: hypothetical protein R6V01_05105 [Thermoplasmatota archaeon]